MCIPACEHHLYPTSTTWAPSLCSLLSPAGSSASRWPQLWLCLTCAPRWTPAMESSVPSLGNDLDSAWINKAASRPLLSDPGRAPEPFPHTPEHTHLSTHPCEHTPVIIHLHAHP